MERPYDAGCPWPIVIACSLDHLAPMRDAALTGLVSGFSVAPFTRRTSAQASSPPFAKKSRFISSLCASQKFCTCLSDLPTNSAAMAFASVPCETTSSRNFFFSSTDQYELVVGRRPGLGSATFSSGGAFGSFGSTLRRLPERFIGGKRSPGVAAAEGMPIAAVVVAVAVVATPATPVAVAATAAKDSTGGMTAGTVVSGGNSVIELMRGRFAPLIDMRILLLASEGVSLPARDGPALLSAAPSSTASLFFLRPFELSTPGVDAALSLGLLRTLAVSSFLEDGMMLLRGPGVEPELTVGFC